MKSIARLSVIIAVLVVFLAPSCKKGEDTPSPEPLKGILKIHFGYVFGSSQLPWQLNQQMVHSTTGDTLTFTNFRFYVSNIKLKRADGVWWSMPESYFLVDAKTTEASTIAVSDIPYANYTAIEYTMGVDSLRNVSGAQTGALSLLNGMFWDWNSGYIMLKAEGYSPNSPTGAFAFHLGGFSGGNNVVTVKTAGFDKIVSIGNGANPTLTLMANPARLWHSSPSVSVRSTIHAPAPEAVVMARDFYNAISLSAIQ